MSPRLSEVMYLTLESLFVLEHGEAKEDQAFQTYTSWLAGQTAQTVLKIARATGSKAAGGAGYGGGQTMVADALGGIGTSLEACSTKIAEASIERAVSKERTAKEKIGLAREALEARKVACVALHPMHTHSSHLIPSTIPALSPHIAQLRDPLT